MSIEAIKTTTKISWLFILTVLLIYPLPQLVIDIYLPSLPAMLLDLHTTQVSLQATLTIYILFLGIAQLFYGPCSDKFGRKSTLLVGCSIFFVSSILSMFTKSIDQLLIMRALQGIGMGCGFAVASAILADVFRGKDLARMTTYSGMVYSLSIILAPVIGSCLQSHIGWRANFFAMAVYGLILIILLYFFVFETNQHLEKDALIPKKLLRNYLSLLTKWNFIENIICLILAYGIMVSFSVVSPFILQTILHVQVMMYGQLLLLVGFSYFIGTSCNAYLLKNLEMRTLIIMGFGIMLISSFGLLGASVLQWFTPASVITFTSISIFGIGFVFPNCFAKALEISPEKGISGALIGSMVLIGTSFISAIVALLHVRSQYSLGYIYFVLTTLSIFIFFFLPILSKTIKIITFKKT